MKTDEDIIRDLTDYIIELDIRRKHALEALIGITACHFDEKVKEPTVMVSATEKPLPKLPKGSHQVKLINKKKCLECPGEFTPKSAKSKYCSPKCESKAWNRTYLQKKKAKNDIPIAPDPEPQVTVDPPVENTADQHRADQDRKLAELKQKYPVKRDKPELKRDFSAAL